MNPVSLTVNGRAVSAAVPPRTHLADFLREHLNLTGTHLRCEQGACGACTVLIDGQPARSCITYAALCNGGTVQTIEGLVDDPVMLALHKAFSEEHGLQCGFCTPGMLVTARDIVLRLPDAADDRIRLELSGNLCRCTGYVGIVRAISRVLAERRAGNLAAAERQLGPVGPVGARTAVAASDTAHARVAAPTQFVDLPFRALGLNGRSPTLELTERFKLSRPPGQVWTFLADPVRVIECLPGASLVQMHGPDEFDARISLKLGPIAAGFVGRARISRDDDRRTGLIVGSGQDGGGGSLASGELSYSVTDAEGGGSAVELNVRMLIAGPLAQFARTGIVNGLIAKIVEQFVSNVEVSLTGARPAAQSTGQIRSASLLWSVILARVSKVLSRF